MALSLRVYTDIPTIVDLADSWRRLQWNPYFDFDFFLHECGCMTKEQTPFVLTYTDNGSLVTIIAGAIQERPIQFQIGYKHWQGPTLNTLIIHRHGILGRDDMQIWSCLEAFLEELLRSGAIDALLLRNMDIKSPAHSLHFPRIPPACQDPFKIIQEHWQLTCPRRFEDFAYSHKWILHNFKRSSNRIRKRSANNYSIKCYTTIEELEVILKHTESVAMKAWQRSFASQTFLDPQTQARYRFRLSRGELKAYLLYFGERPVAFLHGVHYGAGLYFEVTGYDPEFRHEGVGTYLLLRTIQAHPGREDTEFFDFGVGNSRAKSLFCNISFKTADRYLVAQTARLKALNLLRMSCLATHLLGKRLLSVGGFCGRIQTVWRFGHLTGPANSVPPKATRQ